MRPTKVNRAEILLKGQSVFELFKQCRTSKLNGAYQTSHLSKHNQRWQYINWQTLQGCLGWEKQRAGFSPSASHSLRREKKGTHNPRFVGGKTQVSVALLPRGNVLSPLLRTSPVDGSHASLPSLITILCQAAEQHLEGFSEGVGGLSYQNLEVQSKCKAVQILLRLFHLVQGERYWKKPPKIKTGYWKLFQF